MSFFFVAFFFTKCTYCIILLFSAGIIMYSSFCAFSFVKSKVISTHNSARHFPNIFQLIVLRRRNYIFMVCAKIWMFSSLFVRQRFLSFLQVFEKLTIGCLPVDCDYLQFLVLVDFFGNRMKTLLASLSLFLILKSFFKINEIVGRGYSSGLAFVRESEIPIYKAKIRVDQGSISIIQAHQGAPRKCKQIKMYIYVHSQKRKKWISTIN